MANERRLIDANDLPVSKEYCVDEAGFGATFYVVHKDAIDKAPTVDAVEVVHGHKVVRERHRGIAYPMECPICNSKIPSNKPYTEKVEYCSVCGKKLDDTFQNYCPNCGAKMDGERKDNDET